MSLHFHRKEPELSDVDQPCGLPSPESTASFWHSQPSTLLKGHRTTRDLPATADVVIVGSGITGTSAAHHLLTLATKNINVVMLEAREACWGATGRNGGHCQPLLLDHPDDPSIGRFELNNFHDIQSLVEKEAIDCEFVAQPGVRAIFDEEYLNTARSYLLRVDEDAPDLASMMEIVTDKTKLNELRVPGAHGALITSVAARLWPYKFVSHLLEELLTSMDLPGTFNLQTLTPVTRINARRDRPGVILHTERGIIMAKKVILATNAYSSHLLHDFASLIVPYRGQMTALIPPPSLSDENRIKTSIGFESAGNDDYLIQHPNDRGGQLMFGGGKQCGPSMHIFDDSVFDQDVAEYLRHRIMDAMSLPERKSDDPKDNMLEASHIWTGIMGASRDRHPWVGPLPDRPDVYLSAGYNGHGMPSAWLCAKAVAGGVLGTLEGDDADVTFEKAAVAVGLPKSYRITTERLKAADREPRVAAQQWMDMQQGWYAAHAAKP